MIKSRFFDTWLHAELSWNEIAQIFHLEIKRRHEMLSAIAAGQSVEWN